jgi:hypothetical protein
LRHKGLAWDALKKELSLDPWSEDSAGLHKVLLKIYSPCLAELIQTVQIEYFVNSAPSHKKNYEDPSEPETSH